MWSWRSGAAWLVWMCGLCAAWGAEPRPVALVGSVALGKADRRFFEYYVTAELGVVSEDRGEFLEPAEFPKYSMVVWLRECPRKFTPDETAAAKAYVESGGHLLMTNGAIIGALDRPFKAAPWIGAATWGYAQKGWQAEVLRTGDPCLAGVAAAGTPWLSGYHALMKFEGVNVLGKSGEFSTLGYQPLGAGRFIFSTYGPYDCRDETTKAQVLRIYRNLVAQAGPLTESAQAATLLGAAAPGRQLVLWQRDWDGSVESRLIWRPCGPRPEELLATLDFASAREEIDTAFFCAQAAQDVGEVRVKCAPLTAAVARGDTQTCLPGALRVLVMGQAPEVPIDPPQGYAHVDRSRRGPFYLIPAEPLTSAGRPAFRLARYEPRTVWVQVNTRGLAPGAYTSRLEFSTAAGERLAELPIRVEVAPILMPDPRIVQLRTWGGGIGADPRLAREMGRQRCDAGVISYPDAQKIRLRSTETTLQDALRAKASLLRGRTPPPRLDFTRQWDDWLDLYLDHGITFLTLKDTRTGQWWADALTGRTCDMTEPYERWPEDWRAAYVDYYAQLQEYLSERGFLTAYPMWTDEPSYTAIQKNYLPRAKAYCAAGLGPGSTWTTPGWMTPQQVNSFAPWTRDFGMYQYGYPNLRRFLREGFVQLPAQSQVGFTRGGTGLAVRFPHHQSRILGWSVVQQGPPAHFIRTGPIWKGWLYYVDFTAQSWFRTGGVQGERLLAYGSSDLDDASIDMLTSSDWEGARDGVDDANLARMIEWYLPRLKTRAEGTWRRRLEQIEAERALWFTEQGPLAIGQREVHYHHEPKDGPVLDYRYLAATADSTRAIEAAKRHVLGILREMAPHVSPADVQVEWHDWALVRDGQPQITLVHAPGSPAARQAAQQLAEHIRCCCGVTLPVQPTDDLSSVAGPKLLVGLATDKPVKTLADQIDLQLDKRYPGLGGYRIKRFADRQVLAIAAVDEAGLNRGTRNGIRFLRPLGHWLLSPLPHRDAAAQQ